MEQEAQRNLEILTQLARGEPVTQRRLAARLGIALGLTNLYLKRLVRKGHVKITTIPANRVRYLLTPKGLAEKSRLTYEYMEYSLRLYSDARQVLRESLAPLVGEGRRRVAVYGTGEAAELAILTLRELGFEVTVVVGPEERGGSLLGIPVKSCGELDPRVQDLVIVASFAPPDPLPEAIRACGYPADRVLTLYPPVRAPRKAR